MGLLNTPQEDKSNKKISLRTLNEEPIATAVNNGTKKTANLSKIILKKPTKFSIISAIIAWSIILFILWPIVMAFLMFFGGGILINLVDAIFGTNLYSVGSPAIELLVWVVILPWKNFKITAIIVAILSVISSYSSASEVRKYEENMSLLDEEKNKLVIEFSEKEKELKSAEPQLSDKGYPLCPVCNEEFKNKDEIINHLLRNKREFNVLKSRASSGYQEILKEPQFELLRRGFINNAFNELEIEEICKSLLQDKRWLREVESYKYSLWEQEKAILKMTEEKPYLKQKVRSPIPQKIRFEILKRDNYTCQYCGKKSPEVELEVDHIEPYSKTEDNSTENLITSCKDCNRGKRTKDVV